MPPRSAGPKGDTERVGAAIVAAARRLREAGLAAATEGNLSVRIGSDGLLITPSGRRKDELAPRDLVLTTIATPTRGEVAAGGPELSPAPSSDVAIHRSIYSARADVTAVAHAHLPASMALTLAGEIPDPASLPETALFLPRLPVVPLGEPGSEELALRVGQSFADGPDPLPGAVLLERHGAISVASGEPVHAIARAVDLLELVEVLCTTWRDARLLGWSPPDGLGRSANRRRESEPGTWPRDILRPPSPQPTRPARGRTR